MRTVEARRTMQASAERVFDVLTDHEGYVRFPAVRSSTLVRTGSVEPNGVGAVRRISVGIAEFEEEITSFERPTSFEYAIRKGRPPIAHDFGRVTITPTEAGVDVVWATRFAVKIPLIGGIVTAIAARQMARDFGESLRIVEELAR